MAEIIFDTPSIKLGKYRWDRWIVVSGNASDLQAQLGHASLATTGV
jgi:hypothetical protein